MPLERLDPGWLFLLAGSAMLASATLLPALAQLDEARWHRSRALAVEAHRLERLDRHEQFLASIDRRDPDLVRALVATQLNKTTTDRAPFLLEPVRADADASVFPSLEPRELVLPERHRSPSRLERMTTDPRLRPWLIAASGLCIFVGLLPRATRYREPCPAPTPSPAEHASARTASTSASSPLACDALPGR